MDAHRAFLCRLIALHAEEHLDGEFHQVLLACSLVCREFRAIALSYVFCFRRANLTDRHRVQDLWFLTRPETLPTPPLGREPLPNPLQFIRELSISALEDVEDEGYASDGSVWIAEDPYLERLVRDIIAQRAAARRRLEGFTLHTSRPLEWASCPKAFRSLVADVILSHDLDEVMLGGIKGLPQDALLQAMMHAQSLWIEDVNICRTAAADPPRMARASLKELNIVTSPGVVPVLTEWMSSSQGLSFAHVKRLSLTEIRLGELSWAMALIQRMAAAHSVLDSLSLELSPIADPRNLSRVQGLERWSFPSELFSNLQCLDITFPTFFADVGRQVPSFEVLRVLFTGVSQAGWGGSRPPVLKELCIRMHEGEDEEIGDARAIVVSGVKSWTAVAASLGRFAPHLQTIDILISCESEQAAQDESVEKRLREYFQPLSSTLKLRFVC